MVQYLHNFNTMTGKELGNRLEERGIVQVELARKLGVDPGNLNRKLNSPKIVKQQFIEEVENALGIKLTEDTARVPDSIPYKIYQDLKEYSTNLQSKYDNLLAEYNNLQKVHNKVVGEKNLLEGKLEVYESMNPYYKKEPNHPLIVNDAK